jgi:glycine/D-amino acid oxidase-like deaminating enzyme
VADTPLEAKTLRRMGDFLAMMGSPNQQEATRAREALDRLLAQHNMSMTDLGEILRSASKGNGAASSSGASADMVAMWRQLYEDECRLRCVHQRDANIWREEFQKECRLRQTTERSAEERGRTQERQRVAKQKAAAEQAELDRREAEEDQAELAAIEALIKERDAVIKRYGSEEAVLAPCDREKLLKAAVRQWSKFYTHNAPEWTSSICRCVDLRSILILAAKSR